MPIEHIELKKRYFGINEGNFKEYISETETRNYNNLPGVHLVDLTYKTVELKNTTPGVKSGDVLQLHLLDQSNYYIIETWSNSVYAKGFFFVMEGIDFSRPMVLQTLQYIKDGVKKNRLRIRQQGCTVYSNYTADDMKDCPPLEPYKENGETRYDDTLQQLFFTHKVETWLRPLLRSLPRPFPEHPIYEHVPAPPETEEVQQKPPF